MSPTIQFLDFTVNTQQQSVLKGDKRIGITSTAYKLLTYFIEHPNKTVSRNELTEYVWPNRVVTETSLDKLIQRLRKILGDTGQHKKIIRTIHGVGFVFLPEVKSAETLVVTPTQPPAKRHWAIMSLALILITFLTWTFWLKDSSQIELNTTPNQRTETNPQIIALIPDISSLADQDQAWMLRGGLHYLKEHFNQSMNLEINNINLKTLANEEPARYAIKLTNDNKNEAAVMIEVKEVDHQFQALISIRNADGILAENSLSSSSIKNLYDDIASWVQVVLSVESFPPASNTEPAISQDSYAVENYIRGMSAQLSGYPSEAIKYFDLATKEDPRFWLAWYELSLAYRKQGEYQKALAIISVFENVPLTDKNNLMIQNAKALNLYYLGDYASGIAVLNAGIEIAKNSQNNKELTTFLTNKALFSKAMGDLGTALSSTEESIQVIQTLSGNNDGKLGSAYNTLAGIELNMNDLGSAQTHAKLAVEYFQKAGEKRFQATAQSKLSSIYYALGQWNLGENLVKDVLRVQLELDDVLGQTTSYMRLCDYDLLRGDFVAVQSHLETLNELMSHVSSKYQNDSFLITKAKVKTMTGDYLSAQNLLAELKPRITDDNRLFSFYLLSLQLHKMQQDDETWLKVATEFTEHVAFINQPYSYLTKAQLADKQGLLSVAHDAYKQAKKAAIEQQDVSTIADVMNSYLQFLLTNDPEQAYLNLLAAEKYPLPDYPFFKIKADVLFNQGELFKATALMEELKSIAADQWTVDDQLQLEAFREKINQDNAINH